MFKECCKSGIMLTLTLFTILGHSNLEQMFKCLIYVLHASSFWYVTSSFQFL